jgi:hypothetical protein
MIDVMILRQFYERREITEMIWIHDINNSVDSMIKAKSSSALKTVIDTNQINLDIIEWVKRATARKTANQNKGTGQRKWEIFRKMNQKGVFQFSIEVRVLVRIYQDTEVRCYTACS